MEPQYSSREAALIALVSDERILAKASYPVTHTVPVTSYSIKRRLLEFTIPRDCDLVENVTCDQVDWPIYLRGAGADKITLKNLKILMVNALYSKINIVVKIPRDVSEMEEKNIGITFLCTVYNPKARDELRLKTTSIATYIPAPHV